ncbi:MAG: RNA-binding protein [Ruminococcus sp.]|nr:RNA-binding protein [Ruminococcus sp.]
MNDSADKLFEARLSDLVSRAERSGGPVFSHFLDERQCALAEQWCSRNCGELRYLLWGGYPEARRKMLAVYPDYCQDCIMEDLPMVCLTFSYRSSDALTHRDFLGSFMGARLKRETIGDIVTGEGMAQTFVTDVAAKALSSGITKIGRVGVKIREDQPFCMDTSQGYKEISGTVASLRLDCVVSLAANVSREKAAGLIRSEKVEVNHFPPSGVSQELREGDVLSVRGSGRFILSGIGGSTKKGRIHIDLRKFI